MPHDAARRHSSQSSPTSSSTAVTAVTVVVVMQIRAIRYCNLSYSGHVAVAHRDVGKLLDTVPRLPKEVYKYVVLVKRRAGNGKAAAAGLPVYTLLVLMDTMDAGRCSSSSRLQVYKVRRDRVVYMFGPLVHRSPGRPVP